MALEARKLPLWKFPLANLTGTCPDPNFKCSRTVLTIDLKLCKRTALGARKGGVCKFPMADLGGFTNPELETSNVEIGLSQELC